MRTTRWLVSFGIWMAVAACGVGEVDTGNDPTAQSADDVRRRHGSSSSTSSGGGAGGACPGYALPDEAAGCTCPSGHTCTANNCYGGWYCDLSTTRCVNPANVTCPAPATNGSASGGSGSSGTTGPTSTGGTSGGTSGTSGNGNGVGAQGGSVTLLHFAVSGDTRPPSCEDTAGYPTAIINAIGDAEKVAGAQFAIDLGDHMYVCNNDASAAQAQMNLFLQDIQGYHGTWFMTEGNHECMGSGYSGSCPIGSSNVNYNAFLSALAPISSSPYYSFDVQTSLGLARFVVVADNSWDSTEQQWLDQVLSDADANAKYTFVAKHHPVGDTSVAVNTDIIAQIRTHKFALLLTGHTHKYAHSTADNGRDVIIGNAGAPLVSAGTFSGYAIVDQKSDGSLTFTMYDVATGAAQDSWSVGPN